MKNIQLFREKPFPLEMHKVRVVQKLNLLPIEERFKAIEEAGNNTFLLKNEEVFLDMLTDSGTNAMSDRQIGAMMIADDSYAGSRTYFRLEEKVLDFFGKKYFLPAHQGRACEHIIAKVFVKPGDIIPMNYHFTTTKAHIMLCGGEVVELYQEHAIDADHLDDFKGNFDLEKLEETIQKVGKDRIPFVRIELGTNLIGGQPIALENMQEVKKICQKHGIMIVMDSSLLTDNLFFNHTKETQFSTLSLAELNKMIADTADIVYFSARKLGSARGGGIVTNNKEYYDKMKNLIPLYEGFLTYGGMSTREMEALVIGLEESLDFDMISQGPDFIAHFIRMLDAYHIPTVKPAGGLGAHINAKQFVDHIPQEQYPAGALASAIYLISGVRGMERGTISETRNEDGTDQLASMELVRLALPRRVFTLSQITYVVDRMAWLYENRHLIGGLTFTEEPEVLRFFIGKLTQIGNWQEALLEKFRRDFPDSL